MKRTIETEINSIEQLKEYLRENADEKTIVSVILEKCGTDKGEDGADNGR